MKETKKDQRDRKKSGRIRSQIIRFQEENCHWHQIPVGFHMKDLQ